MNQGCLLTLMNDNTDRFFRALLGESEDNVAVVEDIRAASKIRQIKARSMIITQDSSDNDIFCLLNGKVKAVLYSGEGHEIWLDDFQPGDFFGEMAVLTGERRSSSVVAQTKVTVAVFRAEDFLKLMRRHGAFSIAVARWLAERVRHTTQRMFELSALSVTGRVYAELMRGAQPVEAGNNAERVIRPAPSMVELARQVNSTRESVSRTINDLERRGLIVRRDDSIVIFTPAKLAVQSSSQ